MIVAAMLVVVVLFSLRYSTGDPGEEKTAEPQPVPVAGAPSHEDAPDDGGGSPGGAVLVGESAFSALQSEALAILSALGAGEGPEAVRRRLARLARSVRDAAPEDAAAALIALLESGEDAPTGLGFVVGADGVMQETPTWRTALLDLLGQTDPWQSAQYARRLLGAAASADEYALALRNLAWTDTGGNLSGELQDRFRAMLARPAWMRQPSRGFLEAFDLAVVTGAVEQLAPLVAEGSDAETPESRAAFVALDRIMLRDPAKIVGAFAADRDFLARAPMHRASLLARLDPRDPAQAALLADYLLRGDHAPGELDYFTGLFPNGNRFTANRLVTAPEPGGGIAAMAELDGSAFRVLSAWRSEPRFVPRRAELDRILSRLRSADAGR